VDLGILTTPNALGSAFFASQRPGSGSPARHPDSED
jgi:hypothetical protein